MDYLQSVVDVRESCVRVTSLAEKRESSAGEGGDIDRSPAVGE